MEIHDSSAAAKPSSDVARPTDMCSLLSIAEATAALGSDIATTYPSDTSCDYSGEDDAFETQLAPTELPSFSGNLKLLQLDVGKTSPISGLGDQAAGNAKGLQFQKGSVIIDIQVTIGTERITEDQLVAVAKVMLSHLG
ncbi:MAG TPA: hypothetical protein VN759_03805 [Pseudolysinimonas sp.]|nr:hypothetical protein [Pseudolysinimonas sp.]